VCSQTLTYANYDTLGGEVDPILRQESSTISLSKTARSYAASTDAPDYGRGGYSVVIRVKGCDGRIATSNPVHTVIVPREETDPGITYSGTWSVSHCACASGGTTRWTTAKNASVTFRTQPPQDGSGVDVALIMAEANNRGSAAVYVDGVKKATVNTYAASPVNGKITYQILLSGLASHTVKIVNLATAGHPRIDLDATISTAADRRRPCAPAMALQGAFLRWHEGTLVGTPKRAYSLDDAAATRGTCHLRSGYRRRAQSGVHHANCGRPGPPRPGGRKAASGCARGWRPTLPALG
jgi:hypothetical protein